uniref:Uncharacterized protein n=1 Tax=Pipistrellus kuhlii TaxID=59472 RepID=A0A7J7Y9M5_PIPKU|nr:hypothetical protein mPipKuh1_010366 [Pipistrellus kuhlii]
MRLGREITNVRLQISFRSIQGIKGDIMKNEDYCLLNSDICVFKAHKGIRQEGDLRLRSYFCFCSLPAASEELHPLNLSEPSGSYHSSSPNSMAGGLVICFQIPISSLGFSNLACFLLLTL